MQIFPDYSWCAIIVQRPLEPHMVFVQAMLIRIPSINRFWTSPIQIHELHMGGMDQYIYI